MNRVEKEYNYYWNRILEIYKGMSAKDIENTQILIKFCITPNKEKNSQHKYLFHILFVIEMQATDALPSYENLRYCVLHTIWQAHPSINTHLKDFSEKCNHVKTAIFQSISQALYENSEILPFSSPGWWKFIENNFFEINESLSKSSLINELLIFNHKGECIGNKSQYLPPIYVRRSLCKNAASVLIMENASHTLLYQHPCKADNEKEFITQRIPPLHIGWTEDLGHFFFHGMNLRNENHTEYGNAFIRHSNAEIDPFSYQRLLEIVPPETAIPLLSFSLFSILKFLVPGYPSRISVNEPFKTVRKKLKKIIFLSLKGESAENLADAFCGAFSDYGEKYNNKDWRYKVHDGVVIYNNKFKNLDRFINNQLVQDACVLCVNPDFERNDQEIMLQTNVKLSTEEYQEVRNIMEDLLIYFTRRLCDWYNDYLDTYSKQVAQEMWRSYQELYRQIATRMNCTSTQIRDDLNYLEAHHFSENIGTWQSLKDSCKILIQDLQDLIKESDGIYDYKRKQDLSETKIINYQKKQYKEFRKQKKALQDRFFNLSAINEAFSEVDRDNKNQLSKYSYLYTAINLFCSTLENGGVPIKETDTLRRLSMRIFKNMVIGQGKQIDPDLVLNQYLSDEIINQHIICLRTPRNDKTTGWYDSHKNLIYLPYKTYFDSISQYWERLNHSSLPYEKKSFQAELSEKEILITKKNGNTTYNRPECRITVDPAGIGEQLKETVVKIQVEQLSLNKEAYAKLEDLSKIVVPRRSKSK